MRARWPRSTSTTPRPPFSRKYLTSLGCTSRKGSMTTLSLWSAARACQSRPAPGAAGGPAEAPSREHQQPEDPGLGEGARAEEPEAEAQGEGDDEGGRGRAEARLLAPAAAEDGQGGADERIGDEADDGGEGRVPLEAAVEAEAQGHRGIEIGRAHV